MEDMTPYENLANAIILKAVKDYRQTKSERTQAELERFFRSDWYHTLTNVDSEYLIGRLQAVVV